MELRHEWKHIISYSDLLTIRQRLGAITQPDPHAIDGKYHVRSLYFDDALDTALRQKIDGVNMREKFRIRYYNLDPSFIRLEKKSKFNGLGNKQSVTLTKSEAQAIVDGDLAWMIESGQPLSQELYVKMQSPGLMPKIIVDYTREAFFYAPGNTRVTLDYNIRTGLSSTDFLNPDQVMIPASDSGVILEVKWDAFLPDIIRDAVQLKSRRTTAFSKYAACRIYG